MQLLKHVAGRGNRLMNGQNDKVLMTIKEFTKNSTPTSFIRSQGLKRLIVVNIKIRENRRDGTSCAFILE